MTGGSPPLAPKRAPSSPIRAPAAVRSQRARLFNPKFGYAHPDMGDDPQHDPFQAADIALTKQIAAVIEFHYPGHPWFVNVSHEDGIVQISLPALMGPRWKHVVHIWRLKSDPGMRSIVRACGEILERFGLPRNRYSHSDFRAALAQRPIAFSRNAPIPT